MLNAKSELLEKIRLGEDSFFELKEVRFAGDKIRGPSQNDIADELAAFANSRGGVILFGVDDSTRDVVGIPLDKLDVVEAFVRQASEDSIKPPLAPVIERLTLPNSSGQEMPVLRVEIPQPFCASKSGRILLSGWCIETTYSSRSTCSPFSTTQSIADYSVRRIPCAQCTPG